MALTKLEKIRSLFREAVRLKPSERSEFLNRSCDGDRDLQDSVVSLLQEKQQARGRDVDEPTLPDQQLAPPEQRTIGHYRILELLGAGGMGEVYTARDDELDRTVAIKLLPPSHSMDQRAQDRFVNEAQAAASLDHPNICTIHEIGRDKDGRLFIVMPFYEGETVQEAVKKGPLQISDAVEFAVQVCSGLARAHEQGIIHRDIKPANLVITRDRVVKIVDFGLAKRLDVNLSQTGMVLGTVSYMSPEQSRAEQVDHRTDVWSLGVVLYEMLTGLRPFQGEHALEIFGAIAAASPDSPEAIRPDLPEGLAEIVLRCLEKDPASRFQQIDELAEGLKRVAGPAAPQLVSDQTVSDESPGGIASQSEKTQTTVVVSKLSGYFGLLEKMSDEEFDRVIEEFREKVEQIVDRYGGTLSRFSEDELVVLFEDDPVQAVRSTREIHSLVQEQSRRVGSDPDELIRIRSGVHCGEVVSRSRGNQKRLRVGGKTLQVAGSLALQAEEFDILVSPTARRFVEHSFETRAGEAFSLPDSGTTITPRRVAQEIGPHDRLVRLAEAGLTRFAGRDRELELLSLALRDAIGGEGQCVTVQGDVGIGKSRLLYEFRESDDANATEILEAQCQPHNQSVPYLPLIQLLKEWLLGDGAAEVKVIVARVREIEPELLYFVPFILHLFSIRSDDYPLPPHLQGGDLRQAMSEAICGLLTSIALSRPVTICLEDWHWSDDASRGVADQLGEMLAGFPILIVRTFRGDQASSWSNMAHHTSIRLKPLGEDSSRTIVTSVLGTESLPDQILPMIVEKTGGNPFFVEELCRELVESGTLRVADGRAELTRPLLQLRLPETIQAVIRTRIHRLEDEARSLLRIASVAGREFSRDILQDVAPDTDLRLALDKLCKSGLIQQIRVVPQVLYRFKHVLTQELAYASLLQHQQETLHESIGSAIEARLSDRIDEHLDLLAHHFSRAGNWDKAAHYGRLAAKKAESLSQFQEALAMLDSVRDWSVRGTAASGENAQVEILLKQERLCETLGLRQRQQSLIDDLRKALKEKPDTPASAEVWLRQGDLYTLVQRFSKSKEALGKALEMSRRLKDPIAERNTLRSLGLLHWHQAKNVEALGYNEQALEIDRQRGDLDGVTGDLTNLAAVLKDLRKHREALECIEEALQLCDEIQNPIKQGFLHGKAGQIHGILGHPEQARKSVRQAIETSTKHRLTLHQSLYRTSLAHLYLEEGKVEESLKLYREAVDQCRKARHAEGLSQSLRIYGEVLTGLDRPGEALPCLKEAVTIFEQLKDPRTETVLWTRIADIEEQAGSTSEAQSAWNRVRSLCQGTSQPECELKALEGLARVARLEQDEEAALGHYQAALDLALDTSDLKTESRIRNAMGILLWSTSRYESALGHYERALEIFLKLEDPVHMGLMRNSLGATLQKLGRYQDAVAHLNAGLKLHRETGQRQLEAHCLGILGQVQLELADAAGARRSFEDSLEIRRQIGDQKGEAWMLYNLSRTYTVLGEPERSQEYCSQAAVIAGAQHDEKLLDLLGVENNN